MNRSRMNIVVSSSRNALESIYRAGYDAGRDDAEKEHRLEMLWKNFEWLLKDYEAYTHRPVRWWE